MDIDALKASRAAQWARLHDLARTRSLTGEQIDELDLLYRRTTADLADIRTTSPDPDTIRLLSRDLGAARARLTGTQGASTAAISRFFRLSLPAALYSIRWWIIGVTAIFLLAAAAQAAYVIHTPGVLASMGSPESLKNYAHTDFVAYYHQDTNAEFGLSVWANNAWIALQCVGGGITGVYPLYVLMRNAVSLGTSAAVVVEYAGPWHFFRFILPHGLPELMAVFIAGAAGLRVFWALVAPGPVPRIEALARAGRAMATIGVGCVILLFVSGLIEGFVTPSGLPSIVKIGLGSLVLLGVWVYILIVGSYAAEAGADGDLDADAGYALPVAG
ncbi:stage II sporulation protein M [Actinomyces sp. B33]|uniref:stage II sporulation protein M n=1 Tax=Actinomyces sp. B33 TaxID=2942131 RepID=UPI0023406077|nr:stage II sporulation protein M [Actinomyces sp. B33]MDC4232667.1 stage II sporulation protein M [Actinomyces sp. B33]